MRRYQRLLLLVLCFYCLFCRPAIAGRRFDCYTKEGATNCKTALVESSECRLGENEDYEINLKAEGNDIVVLSIHGGLIEPNTSRISADIARRFDWKRYDFKGHATPRCSDYDGSNPAEINRANFRNLHITSTKFNEKQVINLVSSNAKTVSIHGYSLDREYDKGLICVGGRDIKKNTQVQDFIAYIDENKGNLSLVAKDARNAAKGEECGAIGKKFKRLSGKSRNNIANRNPSRAGLQLEFNYEMLESLGDRASSDYEEYGDYRKVIYDAVEYAVDKYKP